MLGVKLSILQICESIERGYPNKALKTKKNKTEVNSLLLKVEHRIIES